MLKSKYPKILGLPYSPSVLLILPFASWVCTMIRLRWLEPRPKCPSSATKRTCRSLGRLAVLRSASLPLNLPWWSEFSKFFIQIKKISSAVCYCFETGRTTKPEVRERRISSSENVTNSFESTIKHFWHYRCMCLWTISNQSTTIWWPESRDLFPWSLL